MRLVRRRRQTRRIDRRRFHDRHHAVVTRHHAVVTQAGSPEASSVLRRSMHCRATRTSTSLPLHNQPLPLAIGDPLQIQTSPLAGPSKTPLPLWPTTTDLPRPSTPYPVLRNIPPPSLRSISSQIAVIFVFVPLLPCVTYACWRTLSFPSIPALQSTTISITPSHPHAKQTGPTGI